MSAEKSEPKPSPLTTPIKSILNHQPDYRRIDEALQNPGAEPSRRRGRGDA